MATLNFGVTDPNLNINVTMQIADNDLPRIMAYLMSTSHGKVEVEGAEPRDATPEETATSFASGVLNGLLNATVRYEKDEAAKAAADAVAPIAPE